MPIEAKPRKKNQNSVKIIQKTRRTLNYTRGLLKLLDALASKNKGRPPVWIMRQAGRYLPEYRVLREKHSLKQLFLQTDKIVQITKMPLARFPLDAAILFSDITIIAEVLGLHLEFQEGPIVTPSVNIGKKSPFSFQPEKYDSILEAISRLKQDLSVPLLGFCGAPFTVATYLIGGLEKTCAWIRQDPASFSLFLDEILKVTIWILQAQENEGVDAVQIFDSWANALSPLEYEKYCLEPLQKLVASVKIPSIFFMREMGRFLEKIPCAISLDWTVSLQEARKRTSKPLQGNLSPNTLFLPLEKIRKETQSIVESMEGDPGFILNLGHGILPNTPIEAVSCFLETAFLK